MGSKFFNFLAQAWLVCLKHIRWLRTSCRPLFLYIVISKASGRVGFLTQASGHNSAHQAFGEWGRARFQLPHRDQASSGLAISFAAAASIRLQAKAACTKATGCIRSGQPQAKWRQERTVITYSTRIMYIVFSSHSRHAYNKSIIFTGVSAAFLWAKQWRASWTFHRQV